MPNHERNRKLRVPAWPDGGPSAMQGRVARGSESVNKEQLQ